MGGALPGAQPGGVGATSVCIPDSVRPSPDELLGITVTVSPVMRLPGPPLCKPLKGLFCAAVQVHHILRKMEETGVDFFADVHGDEELTYNFIAVHTRCTIVCQC